MFSDGGNFCPEEIDEYRKRLEKMSQKIDSSEGFIMADLEGMESKRLEQAAKVAREFEDRLVYCAPPALWPFTPWWCLEESLSEFRMMPWGIIWSPPDTGRHNGNGDTASSIAKPPYNLFFGKKHIIYTHVLVQIFIPEHDTTQTTRLIHG